MAGNSSSGGTPLSSLGGSISEAQALTTEERLRLIDLAIGEKIRARRRAGRFSVHSSCSSSSASAPPSPPRFWRGAREAAKKVLGVGKGPERTGGADETGPERQPADGPTRSDYAAMMRTALEKMEDGAAADDEEAAASAVMDQAMTGLMELTYRKVEPPKLPSEFATKWSQADDGTLQAGVMHNPVILDSGHSIDQSYQERFFPQRSICPVPNHLLRDMIAAWCLDHSSLPPRDEQIQDVVEMLSGNSASQREALHLIQQLSKNTKGVQPCLVKYPGLIQVLIHLKKKWKSPWTREVEEERLTTMLNLTMHRQNRMILSGHSELPGALKKVAHKASSSPSSLGKVASIVAALSELDVFRKRMLGAGGMKMLRDMLKIEDAVVRAEAAAAILALCADDEGKLSAQACDVAGTLLECHVFTDHSLLLLDLLPKGPRVLDKICDKVVELVDAVMCDHTSSPVMTSQSPGVTAISLLYSVVERDVGKMKRVKNLEDLKLWLRQLSSERMPMQTMLQVESIIRTLSDVFPAPFT
ncbi:hypothetical protein GUJ93_ZPchr0006g41260 [Zizania palustris]|uniref:RING-type E3 ubiquitin transferase n=1 Tax=Zizania palustris TaxID=103762 RepID=A0A8J5VHE2_ZIZPA|nr:hypothetical protein GUJ93_ZPchr0006g41260 [Zizania palustris]